MKLIPKSNKTVHCIHCGRTYAYWQFNPIISNQVCVECGEPIVFKEEVECGKGSEDIAPNNTISEEPLQKEVDEE